MSTATKIATGILAGLLSLGAAACGDTPADPALEETGTTGEDGAGADQDDTAEDSFSY